MVATDAEIHCPSFSSLGYLFEPNMISFSRSDVENLYFVEA